MINIINTITTYIPENHGFSTGSNNGNYATWVEFATVNNMVAVRFCSSADGDMLPYPDWEFVPALEWARIFRECRKIEEY